VAVVCQKAKQEGIAKIYFSTYKKGTGSSGSMALK
jgi:hypothetical protein